MLRFMFWSRPPRLLDGSPHGLGRLVPVGAALVLAAGASRSLPPATVTPKAPQTRVPPSAAPTQTGFPSPTAVQLPDLPTPGASGASLLPASIYYLDSPTDPDAAGQVWRLEADGATLTQLTFEGSGVSAFSVSRSDGSLAYVSGNQLFLVDPSGQNRRLVADGTLVDPGIEDYVHRGLVGSPSFSPDGRTLAYDFDGLHLYNVRTGDDEHVLTNLGNLMGESFVFAKENYAPGPWSPDGDRLLIIMGYYEGSTLAVMEPGEAEPFQRLWSPEGAVCCTFDWTPDGASVLVANPSFSNIWPGLWRYDAESGEQTGLVTSLPDSFQYVGWPVQLPSSDLLYFYGDRFTLDEGIPLVMMRSGPDGRDPTQIRPERFHIADALWAEDGSLVIIRQCSDDEPQLVLARPSDSPLQPLVDGCCIRQLAWGP